MAFVPVASASVVPKCDPWPPTIPPTLPIKPCHPPCDELPPVGIPCPPPHPPPTPFVTLTCEPVDGAHTYFGSGTVRAGIWHVLRPTTGITQFNDGNTLDDCGTSASSALYAGNCGQYPWSDPLTYPLPGSGWCDGIPGDFDYELEWSIGGGFFPGGPWATDPICDYGTFPHHGSVPEITDLAYPLLGGLTPARPAFSWGADDTGLGTTGDLTADAGSGKIPATDPSDQAVVGGDGQQCLTSGSITPNTDPDDWLDFCFGDGFNTATTCNGPGRSLDGAKLGGGDGGFVAFTVTAVTHDLGIGDWIVFPLPPGGLYHNHGGYHEACDPTDPAADGYDPTADANSDTWPDLFCHSPLAQDGGATDVPTELYVTVVGEITS